MPTTALDKAESWAVIVTAAAAGFAAVAGSIRFLFLPLGNNWAVTAESCKLRKTVNGWIYVITIAVENRSAMGHHIRGWWLRVRFPDEVREGFDPDSAPDLYGDDEVNEYYGSNARRFEEAYLVSPGEAYRDEPYVNGPESPQQICYVETTLKYKGWSLKWTRPPKRVDVFRSQVLVIAVDREDLQQTNTIFRSLRLAIRRMLGVRLMVPPTG